MKDDADDSITIIDMPIEEWAKLHDLDLSPGICYKCHQPVYFTIPFESNDFIGMKTKDDGCGERYRQIHFKPKDPEVLKEIQESVLAITANLKATKH